MKDKILEKLKLYSASQEVYEIIAPFLRTEKDSACEEALKFLVKVKMYKDLYGKDEYYKRDKSRAWEQARKALGDAE